MRCPNTYRIAFFLLLPHGCFFSNTVRYSTHTGSRNFFFVAAPSFVSTTNTTTVQHVTVRVFSFFFLFDKVTANKEHGPPHGKPEPQDKTTHDRPHGALRHRHHHYHLPRGRRRRLLFLTPAVLLRPNRAGKRRQFRIVVDATRKIQRGRERRSGGGSIGGGVDGWRDSSWV